MPLDWSGTYWSTTEQQAKVVAISPLCTISLQVRYQISTLCV